MFLACNIAHPDTDDKDPDRFDLWDECFQPKMGLEGKPMYFFQIDALRPMRPVDHLTARAILWDILTKELNRLRELKTNYLDPIDEADRAGAEDRAMFDASKEGVLLRRYETTVEREFHKSIADLVKLRKEPVPEPREDAEETALRNEPISELPAESEVASGEPADPRPRTAPVVEPEAVEVAETPFERPAGPESAPATPR